ncbi:uncharacterized protein LOC110855388 isoform X2 [Folsomia candida]|uniref:uncharacterized protein LOC110855388 isoform X2 n=1 Tax=Folsomia candida TaxID=158441 RepID=UPI001605478E|nr:uncharacterized protein LOC110855388 isoform X2 [Folsomia candida]
MRRIISKISSIQARTPCVTGFPQQTDLFIFMMIFPTLSCLLFLLPLILGGSNYGTQEYFESSMYNVSTTAITWGEAYFECVTTHHGSLVAVETSGEYEFVRALMIRYGVGRIWTDGVFDGNTFRWTSTEAAVDLGDWAEWAEGNPILQENYAISIQNSLFNPSLWYTEEWSSTHAYICEIKIESTTLTDAATPSETTFPTEATTPSETTFPTEATTPSETTFPTETTTPSETTFPTEATTPGETTFPTEATTPSKTTFPTEATTPSETTFPTEATTTSETTFPTEATTMEWADASCKLLLTGKPLEIIKI